MNQESALPVRDRVAYRTSDRGARMSVDEIAKRLRIGRLSVYAMLQQNIIPGIQLGRRWIITRHAYGEWERSCGTRPGALLGQQAEVKVVN